MSEMVLLGLDGSNPLHALAALGALLLTEDIAPGEARLGWARRGGRYLPRLGAPMDSEAWAREVATRVQRAGAEAPHNGGGAQRHARETKAAVGKLGKDLKAAEGAAKAEAKARGLRGADTKAYVAERSAGVRAQLDAAARAQEAAQEEAAETLGFGPAHLGAVIGVRPEIFRRHARRALGLEGDPGDRAIARQLAALGSDGCIEREMLQPTPYSFSNGSSGQELLKDFRNLARGCTVNKLVASLLQGEPVEEPRTNLNWDPSALRSAAYQWADPASQEKATDVVVNALAYLGLGMVPCFPGRRGLAAVAFDDGFTWPIWEPLLPVDVVGALLAEPFDAAKPEARRARTARGVAVTFHAARISSNKRYYFSPSRAL